jgi:hypothetical protein
MAQNSGKRKNPNLLAQFELVWPVPILARSGLPIGKAIHSL